LFALNCQSDMEKTYLIMSGHESYLDIQFVMIQKFYR
jgi:hypothetical protein